MGIKETDSAKYTVFGKAPEVAEKPRNYIHKVAERLHYTLEKFSKSSENIRNKSLESNLLSQPEDIIDSTNTAELQLKKYPKEIINGVEYTLLDSIAERIFITGLPLTVDESDQHRLTNNKFVDFFTSNININQFGSQEFIWIAKNRIDEGSKISHEDRILGYLDELISHFLIDRSSYDESSVFDIGHYAIANLRFWEIIGNQSRKQITEWINDLRHYQWYFRHNPEYISENQKIAEFLIIFDKFLEYGKDHLVQENWYKQNA